LSQPKSSGRLGALANKALRGLLAAQFLALMAGYALNFASVLLVEELTHSSAQMSLTILSITLPGLAAGFVAGPVVDRFSRRHVLIVANLLRALVSVGFILGIRSLQGMAILPAIYFTNLSLSTLAQFSAPAEVAIIPCLVRKEELMAANSLLNLSSLGAQGLGFVVVAPFLVKLTGVEGVGVLSALLALMASLQAFLLPKDGLPGGGKSERKALFTELREGWGFMATDRVLSLAVFQMTLASTIGLVLSVILPGFLARYLRREAADVVFIAIPAGIGFGAGTWLMSKKGDMLRKELWMKAGLLSLGSSLALLAFLGDRLFFLALVSAVGIGLGFALIFVPARTILQERPPSWMRGRIVSTQMMLVNAASIGPMLFGGGLADIIGVRNTMLLVSLAVLGAGAINGPKSPTRG